MNIAETFLHTCKKQSSRPAIIEARTRRSITFFELQKKADRYCRILKSKGVQPGTIVMLMVTPSIEFICLTLALFQIGAPIVLIDPGMGYKNLLRCIEKVAPRVLVGIPKALLFSKLFPRHFRTVDRRLCVIPSIGLLGGDLRSGNSDDTLSYSVYQPLLEDLAAIIFTTGSTGPPKGVCFSHSVFAAQLQLIRDYYGVGENDIDQPAFPLFALFSAALGACSIIPDMDATQPARVDPKRFIRSINQYNVTYSFGSPAIWNVVADYCIRKHVTLPSIRKVLMAGAPVPYELLSRVTAILPADAEIYTPYGATECLPVASITGKEILGETWQFSRVGKGTCVGKALPGVDVKIMKIADQPIPNLHQEDILPNGEIGEIIVRGAIATKSYKNNAVETELAKIDDGNGFWHRMGDVGYLDEKNRLWFCGRRAHRVLTEHGTLYTIPCEAIINEHPEVYRSALVGIKQRNQEFPVPIMIIELKKKTIKNKMMILEEVKKLAEKHLLTCKIRHFLIHKGFPVDIRHNAKIFREKLALWAEKQISQHQ